MVCRFLVSDTNVQAASRSLLLKERVKIWATLFLLTKISRCKRRCAAGLTRVATVS